MVAYPFIKGLIKKVSEAYVTALISIGNEKCVHVESPNILQVFTMEPTRVTLHAILAQLKAKKCYATKKQV